MEDGHLKLIIKFKRNFKYDDVQLNTYYNVIDNQIYCYFVSMRQHGRKTMSIFTYWFVCL